MRTELTKPSKLEQLGTILILKKEDAIYIIIQVMVEVDRKEEHEHDRKTDHVIEDDRNREKGGMSQQRWNIARSPRACSGKKFGRLRKDLWKSPHICRLN